MNTRHAVMRGASCLSGRAVRTVLAAMLFAACTAGAAAQTAAERRAAERNEIIYLNLMWHQHQPLYYKDPATGLYTRPWVRAHGTKDYLDMVEILERYPDLRLTYNLTPVLLTQLADLVSGAKDSYRALSEKPAAELTPEDRRFILERFFDANWNNVIARFPRYAELLELRGDGSPESVERARAVFTEREYRDLQLWFNLAWIDPDYLADRPLSELVEKGRGFSEQDKTVLFAEIDRILARIVPAHRRLQDAGRIEVTTTPYAHPILPLLYSTNLAEKGDPSVVKPDWFSYPNDAIAHLRKAAELYRGLFGREPRGLWPAEGAVAEEIVRLVSNAGFSWMASGEHVLASSLGLGSFSRDGNDTVIEADALYRPYIASGTNGGPVAVVFRDVRLSDLIGFEYSGTPAEQAAADFLARIEAIRSKLKAEGKPGPHLVSVILDGENAWENYPLDGKAFFHALYRALSESETVKTITPSAYLEAYPVQRELETLHWGAWFSPDYATWIGEEEENLAWNYLGRTRRALSSYDMTKRKRTTPERLERALEAMYFAEGSDWFWWYGADQDSGNDEYFDEAFRALLAEVYTALGEPVPEFVKVPIIPERPVPPEASPTGPVDAVVDGVERPGEWSAAGRYLAPGGAMARGADDLSGIRYGFSTETLYLLLESRGTWEREGADRQTVLYLSSPRAEASAPTGLSGEILGFRASLAVRLEPAGRGAGLFRVGASGAWAPVTLQAEAAASGKTLELAVPLEALSGTMTGDRLSIKVVSSESGREPEEFPAAGPLTVSVPQLATARPILEITDPAGDDHGPGTYRYPTDRVFSPGSFDITRFTVSDGGSNYVFTFRLNGPIENSWGSGIGLSLQTFDIYIDIDPGAGTGARNLLEGRNAVTRPEDGWEYAVWVEGWNQKVLVPNEAGRPVELPGSPTVLVDSASREVSVLVPKETLAAPTPPVHWGFIAAVLSQEGYPSAGVRRVRDVKPSSEQWKIGGGTGSVNDTRILDLARAGEPAQEELLVNPAPGASGGADRLPPEAFAAVPFVTAEPAAGE